MSDSKPGKQYEFDIAKNRLQTLGALVSERTSAYYRFNRQKDQETAEHLVSILRTLLVELEQDGKENGFDVDELWSSIENLEKRMDGSSKFQFKHVRNKIEEVNRELEEIRKQSGLDIPSKNLKERGQEMLQ